MPDVALENVKENFAPLNWVGMKDIEAPVLISQEQNMLRIPARVEAKVSLDKQASRGIHMSRLYMAVQDALSEKVLSESLLSELTQNFLSTHNNLSSKAFVSVRFEMPILRKALKSQNSAWRTYPVVMSAENSLGKVKNYLEVVVTYSSTCPASAALARQLIQENFKKTFSGQALEFDSIHQWLGTTQGILATPHAQRSFARVKIQCDQAFDVTQLIDLIEEALQTPVQGAVKREDEQEFALRNGQNLMFCEDAARRVKMALDSVPEVADYVAELNHVESLHPHNAVSFVSKGLELKGF